MEDLQEALGLALKVIADWRVLFIAFTVVLAWSALRYVGIVYRKKPLARPRPAKPVSPPAAAKGGRKEKGRSSGVAGEERDEGMVE
jgi:hypothetical protein